MSVEPQATASYPTTASGKRNWAFSAVNPGKERPSFETVPQYEGSIGDFIDIINPLQHLPVVGTIYRAVTGDTIEGPARILGGLLYGGPAGLAAGIGSTVLNQVAGADVGEQLFAMITGSSDETTTASAAARYAANEIVGNKQLFSTAIKI